MTCNLVQLIVILIQIIITIQCSLVLYLMLMRLSNKWTPSQLSTLLIFTLTNYDSSIYAEIEKYAADLEITCDYYLLEFADLEIPDPDSDPNW